MVQLAMERMDTMPNKTNTPCTICGKPANNRGRCPKHTRPNTTKRGYGTSHKQLRAMWTPRVRTGNIPCAKCGQPIHPLQTWDLGHNLDRTKYTGPEHRHCNRSASKKGHQ